MKYQFLRRVLAGTDLLHVAKRDVFADQDVHWIRGFCHCIQDFMHGAKNVQSRADIEINIF